MAGPRANEYAYDKATIDGKTVTSSSSLVLAANVNRRNAVFVNDGAGDLYLAMGQAAVSGKGVFLKASGGSYEINSTNMTHGAIYAISTVGSTLSIQEGY